MTEPEDDEDLVTFDEIMEDIEKAREEHRKQVSYEWVENIRESGELYRELNDIEAVMERLSLTEESAREALTVYRLIFENTPQEVASKAFVPGQTFFSLEHDSVKMDEDEEEPVEDLLREFVGAVYLEQKTAEEPVGEPPAETVPQMQIDVSDLAGGIDTKGITEALHLTIEEAAGLRGIEGMLTQGLDSGLNPDDLLPSSPITSSLIEPEDILPPSPFASLLIEPEYSLPSSPIASSLIDPEDILPPSSFASLLIEPEDFLSLSSVVGAASITGDFNRLFSTWQSTLSDDLARIVSDWSLTTTGLNAFELAVTEPVASSLADVAFPQSLVADLAAIEPSVGAVTTESFAGEKTLPRESWGDSTIIESEGSDLESEISADSVKAESVSIPTELVFDIPASVTTAIFAPKEVRVWFSELPEEYQDTLIGGVLFSIAYFLTGNMATAGLASLMTPAVKKAIIED